MGAIPKTKIVFVRAMPEDLWREVKIEAAKRGITIQEFLISTLRDALKNSA
jgi:predicted DNA binding CopG/RHH family protein